MWAILFIGFLSSEIEYINEALFLLGIDKKELSYEKKWSIRDSFRLKIIDNLMNNPLDVPFYAKNTADFFSESNIDEYLLYIAQQIDVSVRRPKCISRKDIEEFIKLNVERAGKLIEEAFVSLSTEQMDSLLFTIPYLWTDEDDTSDDYYLGIFHKEFGKPRDTSYKLEGIELLRIIQKVDFKKLFESASLMVLLLNEVAKFSDFSTMKDTFIEGVIGRVKKVIKTSYGEIVIGSEDDNVYKRDFLGIIDIGGNDRYENRAGGAIGRFLYPVSFILDLKGDDFYYASKPATQGTGVMGVGILIDKQGNDIYLGGSISQGAGLCGIGILLDEKGNDTYRAGFFTQGAGNFGAGILKDVEGEDVYTAFDFTQGFGSVKGYGLLYDKKGNDVYYAGGRYIHHPLLPEDYRSFAQGFAIGWRDIASGGIGFLLDEEGNDKYIAEVYAHGTSYWYSAGFLVDKKGNDIYSATEYAQGAGIHLSIGCLLDFEGDDHYYSRYGPSQGEGHDLSVGWLWDGDGDDVYYVSGGQGFGLTNSVGIFVDRRGDDVYSKVEKGGEGDANVARGFGGAGIFIDLQGKDVYPREGEAVNDKIWLKGTRGIGMDVERVEPKKEPWYNTTATFPELDTLKEEEKIKKLFEYASEWEVREAIGRVKTARKMLLEYGEKTLKYIFENEFKTYNGLKLRAIKYIVKKMPESSKPFLYKYLSAENDTIRRNAVWLLGELKDTGSVERLINMLDLPQNKRLKVTIIIALGNIGDRKAVDKLIDFLKDKREVIRIKSAEALGKIGDEQAIPYLIQAMDDRFFTVRDACILALSRFKDRALSSIIKAIKDRKEKEVVDFIRLLLKIYESMNEREKNKYKEKFNQVIERYKNTNYLPLKIMIQKLAEKIEAKGKLPVEVLID